jgi:hypothetical protein
MGRSSSLAGLAQGLHYNFMFTNTKVLVLYDRGNVIAASNREVNVFGNRKVKFRYAARCTVRCLAVQRGTITLATQLGRTDRGSLVLVHGHRASC